MMAMISAQLCVAAMAGLGIYMAIRIVALPLNIKLGSAAMMAKITETGVRIETVRAVQAIKVMGGENDRESRWAAAYRKSLRCDQNQTVANVSFATVQSLLDALLRILLTYLGVRGIMEGSLSIGVLYGFLSYQGQFSSKASALVDQYVRWRTTAMYSYRLSDIVLTQKERDIDRVQASSPAWGKIELRSLGFAYAEREAAVFANLSLSIDAGEFVAIVGPSGSGKSTLLKVICGLYPASSGEVLLDGRALSDWGPQAVRRCLGVVMQDDDLLSGSIAENVAFFDEKIDMERVWECLQHASISDDIRRMPLGIETLVGDMGAALSGGQKQRLLLARALYRRPRLLLLDEATSHVDSVCESAINDALKRLNITRIVVAHRAETIRAASRVIKLQGGRITFDSARRQDLTPIHANAGLPTGAQGATDRL
jgi:ATP-binding cassette subfamily B protein RaxB